MYVPDDRFTTKLESVSIQSRKPRPAPAIAAAALAACGGSQQSAANEAAANAMNAASLLGAEEVDDVAGRRAGREHLGDPEPLQLGAERRRARLRETPQVSLGEP